MKEKPSNEEEYNIIKTIDEKKNKSKGVIQKTSFHTHQVKFWKKAVQKYTPEEISGQYFGVNDWGSCQYAGALAFYRTYFEMRKSLSVNETLEVLDIGIEFDSILSFQEIKEERLSFYKNLLKDQENDKDMNTDANKYYQERTKEIIEGLKDIHCADQLMLLYKKSSEDLWGAASELFEASFKNSKLTGIQKSPGFGPIGNVSAQSVNYQTGLQCALLKEYGIIFQEVSFAGFDT